MKRIFSVFAAGLMVAATLVSCSGKKEGPAAEGGDDVKAPVLGDIPTAVLDAKGDDFQITYQAADFGVNAAITHELWVAKAGEEMVGEVQVKADIEKAGITIKQSNISLALQKLGFSVGEDAEVEFALYAYLGSSRGTAALRSNLVKSTLTVCVAKQDDSGLDKIEVIGDFDGWGSDGVAKAGAYLYKYGEKNVYSGLIYYYAKCVNGWKLRVPTATGGWDDSANWGIEETKLDEINAQAKALYDSDPSHPELTELVLANAGSSKDMKIFNHNFYYWSFDRDENKLSVEVLDTWGNHKQPIAFDYMYLVGKVNGWKEFDENFKMKYIPLQHTFYVDATLADEDEIKFMADGQASDKWYLQWGQGEEDGKVAFQGGNIKVAKGGNYRIYLDINHSEVSFDADAYGKDEEGGVEVAERALDRPDEYFIVGSIMGKTWDDVSLSLGRNNDTGIYTYYGLSYKVGDAFKVVKNQKAEWYGVGAGEYTGTRNKLTGTDNFEFEKESGFDVSFNPETGKVTVADSAIPGWGVKGNIMKDGKDDGWATTFPMTQEGDVWTSDELEIMYDGTNTWGFKLCLYGNWDAGDIGVADGTTPQAGVAMPAVAKVGEVGNSNINFNGKARVQFDAKNMTITLLVK